MVGFASAWTLLLGISIVNVMTDPAVYAPDISGWFVFGVRVLVAGLALTVFGSIVRAGRRT